MYIMFDKCATYSFNSNVTENPELLMTFSMMIFCCHKRSNTPFFHGSHIDLKKQVSADVVNDINAPFLLLQSTF